MLRNFSLLAVSILSGCAGQIQANVQNFSNLPPDYAGKKVAVIATLEEQEKSLEWKRYKPIFEMHFAHQGFEISNFEGADYIAFVAYGIGDPKTTTHMGSVPIYGQIGGGTTYHSGSISTGSSGYGSYSGTSYNPPTYGVIGSSNYSYNVTKYNRKIAINLIEKTTEKLVFESIIRSTGSCGIMSEVIDELTEAIFINFPEGSGKFTLPGKFNC